MQEGLAVMTAGCHRPAGVMVPDQLVHISEMVVVLENSWFAKGSARQAACPHSHQKDHRFGGLQRAAQSEACGIEEQLLIIKLMVWLEESGRSLEGVVEVQYLEKIPPP
ncbi:uncharacterized protein LOC135097772 isoform X2 [Scylla paramamosain]|uniref:uncharacterized protein LOC135097772 isoform X2 n=1 Tax=Scylla paramamosain TaxID=85552 RepID=UPI0030829FEB